MASSIRRVHRTREAARAGYNRLSRWYDLLAGSTERKYRDHGLRKLSARPGEWILEIGFGTGHCLVSLAHSVGPSGHIIGVDISEGMLAIAQKRVHQEGMAGLVDFHLGDAADLGFLESNSFDGIFMSFTLELFDTPDIPCVLQECHRVLKAEGRLVVVCMTKTIPPGLAVRIYEWFHERLPNYVDCRPIFAQQALKENGFSIIAASISSMWGLPVETLLSHKTSC